MRLACLLLAAGGGSRFGGRKQLAPIDGKPMLLHRLATLAPLFAGNLYTVLGAYRDEILPLVNDSTRVIEHARWRDGIGSSIAVGVDEITSGGRYDGILIALLDQVRLTKSDFKRLIDQFDGRRIAASWYSGAAGVPAIFPATLFDRLRRLEGDRGAKSILQQMMSEVIQVPMPKAAQDIDSPSDIGLA